MRRMIFSGMFLFALSAGAGEPQSAACTKARALIRPSQTVVRELREQTSVRRSRGEFPLYSPEMKVRHGNLQKQCEDSYNEMRNEGGSTACMAARTAVKVCLSELTDIHNSWTNPGSQNKAP